MNRLRLIAVALPLFCAAAAAAPYSPSDAALAAIRKALDASASWEMTRTFKDSPRALKSSGTVVCKVGEGITWTVLEPFESKVVMGVDFMSFEDEDGTRVKKLSDLPHYDELRKAVDSLVAGDASLFAKVFTAGFEGSDGAWKLTLVPVSGDIRKLLSSVTVEGRELPKRATLENGDGGTSVLSFVKRP
jgi:hypothetical protein